MEPPWRRRRKEEIGQVGSHRARTVDPLERERGENLPALSFQLALLFPWFQMRGSDSAHYITQQKKKKEEEEKKGENEKESSQDEEVLY